MLSKRGGRYIYGSDFMKFVTGAFIFASVLIFGLILGFALIFISVLPDKQPMCETSPKSTDIKDLDWNKPLFHANYEGNRIEISENTFTGQLKLLINGKDQGAPQEDCQKLLEAIKEQQERLKNAN